MGDKKDLLFFKKFHQKILNPLVFRKLGHSSEMQNDDLIQRKGLKGVKWQTSQSDPQVENVKTLVIYKSEQVLK